MKVSASKCYDVNMDYDREVSRKEAAALLGIDPISKKLDLLEVTVYYFDKSGKVRTKLVQREGFNIRYYIEVDYGYEGINSVFLKLEGEAELTKEEERAYNHKQDLYQNKTKNAEIAKLKQLLKKYPDVLNENGD